MKNKYKKTLKKEIKRQKKQIKKWHKQRKERGFSDCDAWNMYQWFIDVAKPMLQKLRDTHVGVPASLCEHASGNGKTSPGNSTPSDGVEKWNEILDKMIFLLNEMDEENCSKKNKYQEELDRVTDEFTRKYGLFGSKLDINEEKPKGKKEKSYRVYFPEDEPGREEIKVLRKKWMKEEMKIAKYRDECKNKFFVLFSQYFWDLWD